MSQSQSPAYTAMAATAVAVVGGSFAVMLQLSDYIGSNFETFYLIIYGDVLFYDIYMIKVLIALFFILFFGLIFLGCGYAWIRSIRELDNDWRSDKTESSSDKVKQEIEYRRNRRLALIATLRIRRVLLKLEKLIDKYVDKNDNLNNYDDSLKENIQKKELLITDNNLKKSLNENINKTS